MPDPYKTKTFKDATVLIDEAARMYRNLAKLMADPDELRKLADVSHTIFAEAAIGAANFSAQCLDDLAREMREES